MQKTKRLWYNDGMVRKHLNHTLFFGGIAATAVISLLITPVSQVFASDATISVNAAEMLTIQVITPDSGAAGDPGDFLRNMVTIQVATNNPTGFTATMTSSSATTALTNQVDSNYTIPTLGSNTTRGAFPDNAWGYSVNDTSAGDSNSIYRPVAALNASAPSYIANVASNSTVTTRDVYFGTKATAAKASGTYSNTVVFNVVSGINTDDTSQSGVTPTNPVTPSSDPIPTDNTPTYVPGNVGGSSTGVTVYTSTSSSSGSGSGSGSGGSGSSASTTTTGTTVTRGDTTTSTYVSPAGVSNTVAVNEGTPLATGLAVTAGVAATTGVVFFVVAKRRQKDDDEEQM